MGPSTLMLRGKTNIFYYLSAGEWVGGGCGWWMVVGVGGGWWHQIRQAVCPTRYKIYYIYKNYKIHENKTITNITKYEVCNLYKIQNTNFIL